MTAVIKVNAADLIPGKVYSTPGASYNEATGGTPAEMPCTHLGGVLKSEMFPPEKGLGDYTENILSSIGITKEKWAALVGEEKEKTGCGGCGWRHKVLNSVSNWFGFGKGRGPELNKALEELLQVTDLAPRPMYECGVFGKCVPNFKPSDKLREVIHNDLQAGCCPGCPKYERKDK